MASMFSSVLQVTDLDDFILPSQQCVKPPTFKQSGSKNDNSKLDVDTKLEKVAITLDDCLACSGCITSAESVLISQQTHHELYSVLRQNTNPVEIGVACPQPMTVVVSVSPQVRAALAAHYHLSMDEAAVKLTGFFKSLGVHYVFDTNFARNFSLIESGEEFVRRFHQSDHNPNALPMLSSACPGWVCYAEKTHGAYIIPHISTVRSPQQVMGVLVKKYFASVIGRSPDQIYHVAVMPCFDKKLESSRTQFLNVDDNVRDVDCVITSSEVVEMLEKEGLRLNDVDGLPMDSQLSNVSEGQLASHSGGGAGGYLEYIAHYASLKLHGVPPSRLSYNVVRNQDFQEVVIQADQKPTLKLALAYGFRNIQNIVQKMKRKRCTYHFVEIMACPHSCNNGGGQVRPEEGESLEERLRTVERLYATQPVMSPWDSTGVLRLYDEWLGGIGSPKAQLLLHTNYNAVGKVNALNVKW